MTKELLSEVLNREIIKFSIEDKADSISFTTKKYAGDDYINIYELAHKCKEWALKHGYPLYSATHENESYCYIGLNAISTKNCYHAYDTYADTEPEAIEKACQWIYDKELKKD